MIDSSIKGKPILINAINRMGYPSCAARPATIKLALAPMRVPFPPRQAPRARLHHKGSKLATPICPISLIKGIIVATKGMLPTKAEAIALIHRISSAATVTSPPVQAIAD